MPFVKCSVDGCNTKLQPIQKLDPDRETWLYRECDVCFRPACEKHSVEINGKIICDRCRRDMEAAAAPRCSTWASTDLPARVAAGGDALPGRGGFVATLVATFLPF